MVVVRQSAEVSFHIRRHTDLPRTHNFNIGPHDILHQSCAEMDGTKIADAVLVSFPHSSCMWGEGALSVQWQREQQHLSPDPLSLRTQLPLAAFPSVPLSGFFWTGLGTQERTEMCTQEQCFLSQQKTVICHCWKAI